MTVLFGFIGGWILFGGLGSMVLSLVLFRFHHPRKWAESVPTVSEASSYAPSEALFALLMGSVGVAIALGWLFYFAYNRRAIGPQAPAGQYIAIGVTLGLGLTQAVSVFLLAVFSLRTGHDIHMAASYGAFIAGALAFLFDSFVAGRWRDTRSPWLRRWRLRRARLALAVVAASLLFLYMFITKNRDPFGNMLVTRIVYVTSELTMATLSFLYAPICAAEMIAVRRDPGRLQCIT